jgi:MFS family permease
VRRSLSAVGAVFASPDLRRLQLAGAAGQLGAWSYWIVVSLYAYAHGGAVTVGIVAALRLAAVAISSPFAGVIADRFSRQRVLLVADTTRALSLLAAAAVDAANGPAAVVIAFVVLFAIAGAAFRPALSALLPALARTPAELTAANVTASAIESSAWFAGPAIGGLVVAASGTVAGFLVGAGCLAVSALLILRIQTHEQPPGAGETAEGTLAHAADGLKAIAENRGVALLIGLFAAQTFVSGALGVLNVVLAKEQLHGGAAQVGYLSAAMGLGGVIGSAGSLGLVGSRRLATTFGLGILAWGVPLIVIGAYPELALAIALYVGLGIGNTLADVSGYTLMQRAVPDRVLARVSGVFEGVAYITPALGALLVPLILQVVDVRWTFVIIGIVLPVVVALAWRPLRRLDRGPDAQLGERLRLVGGLPVFAPLPPPELETIARELVEVDLAAGQVLFHAGDPGDRFYIIADGEVLVTPPDAEPRVMGPTESFGEIALLRDRPRTADVAARSAVRLYGLERGLFVATVTGYADSQAEVEATISARLGNLGGRALGGAA